MAPAVPPHLDRKITLKQRREVTYAFFVVRVESLLAIFGNEITTIRTSSTSEGSELGWGGHVLRFGGPRLQIRDVNIPDFREIDSVYAGPLMGEPYRFWKQSAQ